MIEFPETLIDCVKYFSDPDNALRFMLLLRFPNGVFCPRCKHLEVSFISTRRIWKCKGCKKQFSVKTGTVMEESPLGLDKWFAGMWLICNAKNGISSYEIARSLGITQKSAWFLSHRIRLVMQTGTFEKLSGTVEADETFIGGKEINKHKNKKGNVGGGCGGKLVVLGLLERHTKTVRTKHIADRKKRTIETEVRSNVVEGAELFTDTLRSYNGLDTDYVHKSVDHLDTYVSGAVHTNGLENYWSLFKRCFHGTWTHLSDSHLHRYLIEQEYRFNNRLDKDGGRFACAVASVEGKRLTYKELIGKD